MSDLTVWAASALKTDEDILVPVKKLWTAYSEQTHGISLEEFTRELEEDTRFEFFEGVDHSDRSDMAGEAIEEYEHDMEAHGFYSGPRVKLKSREITPEHIAAMIQKHTTRMMEALWAAYDVRPSDLGEESEKELLDIIARAKEFQLKAQDAMAPSRQKGKKD